jgi:CHAD domain-containing protein
MPEFKCLKSDHAAICFKGGQALGWLRFQRGHTALDDMSHTFVPKDCDVKHWMRRTLKTCGNVAKDWNVDSVHDLRVTLRHCISIADVMLELDPHPDWKRMRRSARQLLRHLGALRDHDVLLGWIDHFGSSDPLGQSLAESLRSNEQRLRAEGLDALERFPRHKWRAWSKGLSPRVKLIPANGLAAQYLVLERWVEAHEFHRISLRSRSKVAFHRTRIRLKQFRYTLECFMPLQHAQLRADLKQLQDTLGEIHDLDLLCAQLRSLRTPANMTESQNWKSKIQMVQKERLSSYLARTRGKDSLWHVWRKQLPQGDLLDDAIVAKLAVWAALHSPAPRHGPRVADIALQIYDVLATEGLAAGVPSARSRHILRAAALMIDVGRFEGNKGRHKAAYRLIRKLPVPIGWRHAELQLAALAVRYHRKALPQLKHREFSSLPPDFQRATLYMAGILRLANSFARAPEGAIRKLDFDSCPEGLVIRVYGFTGVEPLLTELATAKHLLEIASQRAILIIPGAKGMPLHSRAASDATAADADRGADSVSAA